MEKQAVVMYQCRFCGAAHPDHSMVKNGYCPACKERFFASINRITGKGTVEKPQKLSVGDIIGIIWKIIVFLLIAGFIAIQFLYP